MYILTIFSASPEQNMNVNNFWDLEAKDWADYSQVCRQGSQSLCLWLPNAAAFYDSKPC